MSGPTDVTQTEGEVTALVLRWQELRRRGNAPTVEALCAGRPDLADEVARRVRAVEAAERALTLAGDTVAPEGPVSGDGRAAPVPGYEVLGELGRGGMGVVYRARQKGLDRVVALKLVLAGEHAAPSETLRF